MFFIPVLIELGASGIWGTAGRGLDLGGIRGFLGRSA